MENAQQTSGAPTHKEGTQEEQGITVFVPSNSSSDTPTSSDENDSTARVLQDEVDNSRYKHERDSWFHISKQFLNFIGPAVMISIGYVDPGNWATDIIGGAEYEYKLLWVLLMSNWVAIFIQSLSAKLGLVTGKDLPQQCANYYPTTISLILWALAELAIAATDLAEVLGTAIGLNMMFGLPLIWGVILTALDTLLFLVFQVLGHRFMELFISVLMLIVSVCFVIQLFVFAKPNVQHVLDGFIPRLPPGSLTVACGILGATIMPHNVYLHSGLILSRRSDDKVINRRNLIFSVIDNTLSLHIALFVNASILIVSGATFFTQSEKPQIIQDAYKMLQKIFGNASAIIFGIGLLAAGQASTITGTIAGQIVMEGFLNMRMWPWLRRLITRLVAIVPAVVVIWVTGDDGTYLLVWSQVILSIQLPFAMIPLIRITNHHTMGEYKNHKVIAIIGWICSLLVIGLNIWLLVDLIIGNFASIAWWGWVVIVLVALVFLALLSIVTFYPIKPKQHEQIVPQFVIEEPSQEMVEKPNRIDSQEDLQMQEQEENK